MTNQTEARSLSKFIGTLYGWFLGIVAAPLFILVTILWACSIIVRMLGELVAFLWTLAFGREKEHKHD